MGQLTASMVWGPVSLYFALKIAIVMAAALIGFASLGWRIFAQWLSGVRSRNWATVSAIVDVVSVAPQTSEKGAIIAYLATLTYFYRNPELQMGEYTHAFGAKADAQAWADSFKGKTVMVHLDPRDPARSVLRKEELIAG